MKKKIFITLILCIILIGAVGCSKKEGTKKDKITGPRVVCTYSKKVDGIQTTSNVTLKFNSDNYLNYQLMEVTLTFDDKETFNYYKDIVSKNDKTNDESAEYDHHIDSKKKQISTYMLLKEKSFDYSKLTDSEKDGYLASTIIESYTKADDTTCEFIEITREELGIK